MKAIDSDLQAFTASLSQDVYCTNDGAWYVLPYYQHNVRVLFGGEAERLAAIGSAFNKVLEKASDAKLPHLIQAGDGVMRLLESNQSPKVAAQLDRLNINLCALLTRSGLKSKSLPAKDQLMLIESLAREWKREQTCFDQEELTGEESGILSRICAFPEFTDLIIKNTKLKESFFNWSLRDKNCPEPFAHYPHIAERLLACNLSPRIGFFGGDGLQMVNGALTLPFEGRRINILDEDAVIEFRGKYQLRIAEIFKVFQERNLEIGNLEYFAKGICNWNAKNCSWFDAEKKEHIPLDFKQDRWWEALPVVQELTSEEASKRYGLEADGKRWIFSLHATREARDHLPIGAHGWLQAAIPIDGSYRIFDFGKMAAAFPRNWLENLTVSAQTLPAVVCFPDENIFNTHRQHAWKAAAASEAEGRAIMRSIHKDLLRARENDLAFQFLCENCCKWAWKKIHHHLGDDRIPKLFQISIDQLVISGTPGVIYNFLVTLPYGIRWSIASFFFFLLGSWRGMWIPKKNGEVRHISLLRSPPWDWNRYLYHPSNIFNKT